MQSLGVKQEYRKKRSKSLIFKFSLLSMNNSVKFFVPPVYTILFLKLFLESRLRKLGLNCYMSKLLRAKIKL